MLKQLERPGGGPVPDESNPLQNDDVGMQKVLEAKALLARIEERKARDAENLRRIYETEMRAIAKAVDNRTKGGYCGC